MTVVIGIPPQKTSGMEVEIMDVEVRLPEIGDEGEDTTVSLWMVDPGEKVQEGADLVDVVSGKASFTVPSPVSGTVKEIINDEGEKISSGDLLCIISTDEDGE